MSQVGIKDGRTFVQHLYKSSDLIYLSSCACGQIMLDNIQAEIDDLLSTHSWVDITVSISYYLLLF